MSVAFILNPGYNTINNVHHTFWNQDEDNIKNESLNPVLAVATSLSAPSHIVTGGTTPAQLYMSDAITLSTDAPQFKAPILQAPSAELQEVTELVPDTGITFLNDAHFTSGTGVDEVIRDIDGVGTLTCSTLKYTTLDPPVSGGDPSTWSEYPATQDVDLVSNNLTSSTDLINLNKDTTISKPINTIFTVSASDSTSANSGALITCTAGGDATSYSQFAMFCNSGKQDAKEPSGFSYTAGAGTMSSADGRDLIFQSGSSNTATTSNIRFAYSESKKAYTINKDGALNFNADWNGTSPIIEGSYGTSGQIIQSNGSSAAPSWVDAPTASNWSTYAATSSINTANNSITNASGSEVTISSPNTTIINNGSTELFIKANNDAVSTAVLHFQSGADPEAAVSGYIYMNPSSPPSGGSSTFTNLPNSFSVSSGGTSDLVLSAGGYYPTNCHISYAVNQAYTVNPSGALAFNSSNYGLFTLGNFGTVGQVIQSNGSSAPPTWVDAPTASNWSTYDATSDVDLAGYSLTDTTGPVKANKQLQITNTDNKQAKLISILSPINDTSVNGAISINTNTGFAGQNIAQFASIPVGATSTNFAARSGVVVSTTDGDASIVPIGGSGSVRLGYSSGTKAVTVNSNGALAFNSSYSGSVMTEGSFGSSGSVLASASSSSPPTWSDVNTLINQTDNVLYVAKNGLDTNKGNISFQKLTIQSAINTATSLYPQQVVILVAPGVYSESLSITRPNITLLGYSPSSQQNLLTQIAGNISIACTASQDLYYSQVCIANLLVSGSIIDTSTVVHTLNIEACRIAANGQVFAQTSSADNRTRLVKCTLLQAALTADVNPMMLFTSGSILLNQLDVTAKNNCNLVKFNGTAILPTCALCTFTSDSASTVAEPIVLLAPTNGANKPFTFGYNAFIYSSYAPKLSHPESAGICVSSGTGRPYITVAYNSFALAGTDATNYAIYDTGYNTATAGYYFYFSNNGGVNPAGINAVVPVLADFGAQASVIYGFSSGGSQNKYTLSAVA